MLRASSLLIVALAAAGCPGQRRPDPQVQARIRQRVEEEEARRRAEEAAATPRPAPSPAPTAERRGDLAAEVGALEAALAAAGAKDWDALLRRCEAARVGAQALQERAILAGDAAGEEAALELLDRLQVVRARVVERR